MISNLIEKNRSYRRFNEADRFPDGFLEELIELARLSPSARNQQALKFKIVTSPEGCELVFPNLAWAGYLADWHGPAPGERPSGYIMILGDTGLGKSFSIDLGIAAQSIMLGAVEAGYGGCMIASVDKKNLRRDFSILDQYEILLILALGKPDEKVVIERMVDGDIKYWRDEGGIHHVPKRALKDLLL